MYHSDKTVLTRECQDLVDNTARPPLTLRHLPPGVYASSLRRLRQRGFSSIHPPGDSTLRSCLRIPPLHHSLSLPVLLPRPLSTIAMPLGSPYLCHSTCSPLSPSPYENIFVIGPAVINIIPPPTQQRWEPLLGWRTRDR